MSMKQMSAAKFKEQCLSILDSVDEEGLVITKHGKPVAKLMPIGAASSELIGSQTDRIQVHGEILSTGIRWHVES